MSEIERERENRKKSFGNEIACCSVTDNVDCVVSSENTWNALTCQIKMHNHAHCSLLLSHSRTQTQSQSTSKRDTVRGGVCIWHTASRKISCSVSPQQWKFFIKLKVPKDFYRQKFSSRQNMLHQIILSTFLSKWNKLFNANILMLHSFSEHPVHIQRQTHSTERIFICSCSSFSIGEIHQNKKW